MAKSRTAKSSSSKKKNSNDTGKKKANSTPKKRQNTKKSSGSQTAGRSSSAGKTVEQRMEEIDRNTADILFIIGIAVTIFLFIGNFGWGGYIGDVVSGCLFGLIGLLAYIFPLLLLVGIGYGLSAHKNVRTTINLISAVIFLLFLDMFIGLIVYDGKAMDPILAYQNSSMHKNGAGLLGGGLTAFFVPLFGTVGAYIFDLMFMVISVILISRKSLMKWLKARGIVMADQRKARKEERRRQQEEAEYEEEDGFEEDEPEEEEAAEEAPYEKPRPQKQDRRRKPKAVPAFEEEEEEEEETPRPPKRRSEQKHRGFTTGVTVGPDESEIPSDDMGEVTIETYPADPEAAEKAGPKTGKKKHRDPISGEVFEEAENASQQKAPAREAEQEDPDALDPFDLFEYGDAEDDISRTDRYPVSDEMRELQKEQEKEKELKSGEKSEWKESCGQDREFEADEEAGRDRGFEADEEAGWNREFEADEETGRDREFEADEVAGSEEETGSERVPEAGKENARRTPSAAGEDSPQQVIPKAKPRMSDSEMEKETDRVDQEAQNNLRQEILYVFPTPALLQQPDRSGSNQNREALETTKRKLEETLQNFGVDAEVVNYSCGPAVTRFEIKPAMGVKVSKIVGLADDIKLNLAAADIRIEAPIPGKAAVGIEVPNARSATVHFRELIESEEFKRSASKLTFAVGKDIAGKVKIADIAKMPHLLIAGATGSGKSVCINTIIMSILYKAKPDEVKLIMIDPKVVELSVYNGIPHLLIPVVTDPKKAAGALNWAVEAMTERYQKFADCAVRDIKGYNEKIERIEVPEGQERPKKMPQIVIIVDELADLMMVASKEVEESICRLAQLARAAGIHLIIATQRPSVNVITGLIKANMPSRIAFAVTSGIDSRTILDMIGAEKLLGRGDMLFDPQGAPKPMRVQGAFISDEEVQAVVDEIKNRNGAGTISDEVVKKLDSMSASGTTVTISNQEPEDGRDSYFVEAARIIVDKEKASIGMLQRYLKVGFNRAARIMDSLEEAGVVGPDLGTKPRTVLMTMEQLEEYLAENDLK